MNIRATELLYLLRGYDLEPGKASALREDMETKAKNFRDYREDAKQTSKLTGPLDPRDPLFRLYYSNDERNKKELREAVVDYVSYGHGKMFDAIREAYKDSDKPLHEIAQLFSEVFGRLNFPRVEDSEDLLSFPDCNTPEAIFDRVKEAILDDMKITIPIPLESFISRIPDFSLFIDDKGFKQMFDGKTKAGEKREIKLNSPGRKSMIREIEFVKQEYGEAMEEWGLDIFEEAVALQLMALWADGTKAFTMQTIASAWEDREKETDTKAGPGLLQRIKQAIIKLSRWVKINYLPEAIAYPEGFIYQPGEVYQYEGPLFFVRIDTTMKLNNQVTHEGIKLVAEPILLELAKKKAQYTKLPASIYKTPGSLTVKKVELEFYLLGRLEQMRRSKKKNAKNIPLTIRTILWDTLFAKTGIDAKATPSVKKKQMEKALAMLDAWKQAGELLLDYASTPEAIYIAIEEPHLKEIQRKKRA